MTVTQDDTWQEQMQQLLHGGAVYTREAPRVHTSVGHNAVGR